MHLYSAIQQWGKWAKVVRPKLAQIPVSRVLESYPNHQRRKQHLVSYRGQPQSPSSSIQLLDSRNATLLCAVGVRIAPLLHLHYYLYILHRWIQSLKRLPKAMEVPDGLPTYLPAVCYMLSAVSTGRTSLACAKMRHLRLLGVNSTGPWNQTGRERTELVEISAVDWNKCASHWGNLSPLVESASPYPLDVAVETRQDEDGKLCFQLSIGANKNATEGKEARHRFCRRSTHRV